MFVGHLAVSLGARAAEPRVPLSVFVAASFGIDLLWPLFLLVNLEAVAVAPGSTAFTPYAFESYPWSHSLLMVLGWGLVAGWLVYSRISVPRAALLVGAVVISHWVLDFVTHRPDLPLWPGGPQAGLGLWNSIPGTLVVEGGLLAAALLFYTRRVKSRDGKGTWLLWTLVVLTGTLWVSQPWAPPAPDATAVALTALGLWILPLWAHWIERHRGRSLEG